MYALAAHSNRTSNGAGHLTAGGTAMSEANPMVIIVDDDVSIRESLQPALELAGWTVKSFESATAFLESEAPEGPSCLLLDVSLPDLSGLDLQARIADRRAEMPIIFMTGYGDVPMTVRAMKAGAAEFLTKPLDEEILFAAVERAIAQSRIAVRERAAMRAIKARYASLSRREREVLRLIVAGRLNKQVGGDLGISEITVKAHRGRVMEKMKAGSFADLVKMSAKLRLEE
ncbi:response regulator transcription factor [Sphingosinicella sp. BN140058]|uniref:response regulator transcription factor n=1 Tax=Sphingosinicella sp. BN140058 TaxID=1892855 RepID=UPI001FB0EAAF|nr:response regulator [Sphingosinicella sp. BN140058]